MILGISFRPPEFNRDLCEKETIAFHLLSDVDRAVMKRYGVWNEKDDAAQRVTFLVDRPGIIRHVDRKVNPPTHGEDLVRLVKSRMKGASFYGTRCSRCHGEDGAATGYPNIKPLAGLWRRMTPEQIIHATRASGLASIEDLSESQQRALALYVSGL